MNQITICNVKGAAHRDKNSTPSSALRSILLSLSTLFRLWGTQIRLLETLFRVTADSSFQQKSFYKLLAQHQTAGILVETKTALTKK